VIVVIALMSLTIVALVGVVCVQQRSIFHLRKTLDTVADILDDGV
jgi:uncharacterized membrane protein (Fun14 family)